MKAVGYTKAGTPEVLTDIELPVPHTTGKDILVEVKAISVNPADTKVRTGAPAPEGTSKVLGWDVAGIVREIGEDVTMFKVGDEVWYAGDLTRQGGYAEFHLVDERIVSRKPKSIDFASAAALPLTAITAYEMLFHRLDVLKDDAHRSLSILVVGAAGGVGSILVQLAAQLTGLRIIATASRDETKVWVKELGAHDVIDHRNPLSEELSAIGISEVDYVVSLTQTEQHIEEIVKVLKPQGKFGLIDDPKSFNILLFKRKCISVHWEFMFTRSMFKTEDMIAQSKLLETVAAMVDDGRIRSTVAEHLGTINAANLQKAHTMIESGATRGKIVLEGF